MTRRSMLLPAAMAAVLATTPALAQVFVKQKWILPSLLGIAVAFGIGWAGRRLDVPGVLAPALSLLGLVTLLGILFHPGTTAFGLPTSATMSAIGTSFGDAGRDIRALAAPVDATPALTLLAVAGVFVVSTLVDVLVFRVRRPVAAGLPLLGLFLVPTAMAPRANSFAFVLAAFGYLGLLVAEGRDRARSWGRRLSGIDILDDTADVSHVARVGRRIGTAAVGLALCVPLALPSVGKGILDSPGGSPFGRGDGSRTATVINPLVQISGRLKQDKVTELFVVRTQQAPEYLRLTSLDDFNGDEWSLVPREVKSDKKVGADKTIPRPIELRGVATRETRQRVEIGQLEVPWLPVPYAPSVVDVQGDWRYEPFGLSVFSARGNSRNVTYDTVSNVPEPTVEQLRAPGEIPESIKTYLRVPPRTPPIALQVLDQELKGRTNPYDKAIALNEYFYSKGGFEYTLDVQPGNDKDSLSNFLEQKKGYCEQFAATMAYLARLADIPARVVVGFTPGQALNGGEYVVTNRDAHAWPELYFPNAGWVRFEPTPRSDGGTDVPGYAQSPTPSGVPTGQPTISPTDPTATPTAAPDRPRGAATAEDLGDIADGTDEPGARTAGGGIPVLPLALAVGLVLLVTPSLTGALVRRRRVRGASDHLARIHAAWLALADVAEDTGHALRASDSPRAAARRLVADASLTGEAADAVARLAQAEERARYARSAPPVDGLDAGVRMVRRALLAGLPRVARARALVFPVSSLRRIADAGRSTADRAERVRSALAARALGMVRRRPRTA